MSNIKENLKYSKTHEWVRMEGNIAVIGISDYAQDSLGSVVYLEVGEVGDQLQQFSDCGAIESVKAASDLQAPISGEIVEVNEEVIDNPELINEDCYKHWIMKVKVSDESELDNLLDSEAYQAELS